MNLISLDRVGLALKDGLLFDGFTLGIDEGDRIGLVGKNGSGKTSLLRLITGELEPDRGSIARKRGLSIAVLEQQPVFEEATSLLDFLYRDRLPETLLASRRRSLLSSMGAELAAVEASLEAYGPVSLENRYLAYCGELGLDEPDRLMSTFSGGMAKKAALARALAATADLLLLDEPTNHLDLETVEWLEDHLLSREGAFLLVTHDRWFLDSVSTAILEIDRREVYRHPGNYSGFLERKAGRYASLDKAENRRLARLKIELAWLGRGARARAGKSERRKDEIRAMAASGFAREASGARFSSTATRLGKKGIEFKAATKGFGDVPVLELFTWDFLPGTRVGVVGPNGSGKTTLLRLAAGHLAPDSGKVIRGETLRLAFFEQTAESMDGTARVVDYVKAQAERVSLGDGTVLTAEDLLERFGFPRDFQAMVISRLSGGERRRLQLVRLLATSPNVLILDEPTNDFDIETIELLEDYLDDFGGSLLVVSHDRAFLDRCAETLVVLDGRGGATTFPGGFGDWLAGRRGARTSASAPADQDTGASMSLPPSSASGFSARSVQLPEPSSPPGKPRLSWSERRELDTLLEEIGSLEAEKAQLEHIFSSGERRTGDPASEHASQARRYSELDGLLEAKIARWETLAGREA
jgi:ATP-binding cassette subfamily F protein uup